MGCHFRCIFFLSAFQDKTQETSGEQVLGEPHPQEMRDQAQDQDDSDNASAAPVLDSTSPADTQL